MAITYPTVFPKNTSDEVKWSVLADLVREARGPLNGNFESLLSVIADFEVEYSLSSAKLLEDLRSGALKETARIAIWLMLLETKTACGR